MASKVQENGNAPATSNTASLDISAPANSSAAALLPHLESLDRMLKLPVVDATWQQTQNVYGRVKDYNPLLTWALGTAEDVVCRAVTISAPLVHKLDRPLQLVDQTLVKGIDKLEVNAPIIKEQPAEIYQQARTRVIETVKPHIEKVCELRSASQQRAASLKDLSWRKANEVLATQYGSLAVNGVDTTAQLAERLLDYYFPKSDTDTDDDNASNCRSLSHSAHLRKGRPCAAHGANRRPPVEQGGSPCLPDRLNAGEVSSQGGRPRLRCHAHRRASSDTVPQLHQREAAIGRRATGGRRYQGHGHRQHHPRRSPVLLCHHV
uniref:Lipid storage droplets surface-binding protein 2 n=1 Tax=Anopheles atroparvus TaxID=41427 RepID=A0AAG5DPT1_ANOAO